MLLLALFALVAGAATSVSPCVLPVLPALLAASGDGGRRRPLGVVLGHGITFFVTIVVLAQVVDGVGLGDGTIRSIAIIALLLFGIVVAVPRLGDRLEAPLSRLARFGPKSKGDGFVSGLFVGGALGFLYAPCAGPILAGVVSVGATQGATGETLIIGAAYALGSSATLLLIAFGGRRVVERLRRGARGPQLQQALGGLMILTAVAMAAELDVRFQTALASDFPSVFSNPTKVIEDSGAVKERLADLRGEARFDDDRSPNTASTLPVLGVAPDFVGNQRWFNSEPLSLGALKGKVVLIDFWTYTCINCIRTFPALRALDERYRDKGLTIVGVHTPEFAFEKDARNVERAISQNRLRYPVAQDNDFATWEAWGNQYWPAKYLIDAEGRVRYTHFGEGDYEETEQAVRDLLEEAGASALETPRAPAVDTPDPGTTTPETYLGSARAERFLPGPLADGTADYPGADELPDEHFALSGRWTVDEESSTAVKGAAIDASFQSRRVFLVLSSRGGTPRKVRVLLDGKPVTDAQAGDDVRNGVATITDQRLYRLVELPAVERHRLTLEVAPGVQGFAFTFG